MTPEETELTTLRARVRELEAAQRQLEIYAEDLRRTFGELRRQLGYMNELHRISTMIGSVLEPREVMARTLEGVGRLVANQAACIYLIEGDEAVRVGLRRRRIAAARRARADRRARRSARSLPVPMSTPIPDDARSLMVAMRASGVAVGALHLIRTHGAPLIDDDRKLTELVAAEAAAAIHNARLYEQTQRLATTDALTNLSNHRFFRDALALEIARASRLGYALGLLMIDVDNFKRVNDTLGHPVGDEVLRSIARGARLEPPPDRRGRALRRRGVRDRPPGPRAAGRARRRREAPTGGEGAETAGLGRGARRSRSRSASEACRRPIQTSTRST